MPVTIYPILPALPALFTGTFSAQLEGFQRRRQPHLPSLGHWKWIFLYSLWETAAQTEPDRVPKPEAYTTGKPLASVPQFVQRGLNALARSSFCANIAQAFLIGNLRQVTRYFSDKHVRETAIESVVNLLKPETRVVVAHSLGSVVAYEALFKVNHNVKSFVTIGSPLAMPNIIFEKLDPAPSADRRARWPDRIQYWTNIADRGDLVANPKKLKPLFGGDLKDIPINNGSDAHHGERYLTAVETGLAIRQGLTQQ